MKYSVVAAVFAATGAMATKNETIPVVTETVSSIVTYCPEPTEITHGTNTYTVTEPTTLTITDCPCTVTKPVTTISPPTDIPAPPPAPTNGTIPGVPQPTGGVPPPSSDTPEAPQPTGAASKATVGLAGLVGLAAFFL